MLKLLHLAAVIHSLLRFLADSWTGVFSKISPLPLVGLLGNRGDEANHPDRQEGRELEQSYRMRISMRDSHERVKDGRREGRRETKMREILKERKEGGKGSEFMGKCE